MTTPAATPSGTPPGVIPYIDVHDGPKRLVAVTIEPVKALLSGVTEKMLMPTLSVDGRPFVVYWGTVTVEAPADRAVHLAVGMQDGMREGDIVTTDRSVDAPKEEWRWVYKRQTCLRCGAPVEVFDLPRGRTCYACPVEQPDCGVASPPTS